MATCPSSFVCFEPIRKGRRRRRKERWREEQEEGWGRNEDKGGKG